MTTVLRARTIAVGAVVSVLMGACAVPPQPPPAPATEVAITATPMEASAEVTQAPAAFGNIVFMSTQANPVEEAEAMRSQILAGFTGGSVEFVPEATGPFADRISAEAAAGSGAVDVVGGLVGDLSPHADKFRDLSELKRRLGDRGIPDAYWAISNLGTDKPVMVPWMQATLIMAVNKKALEYLPQGADVNNLTYDQLLEWGKAIKDATGEAKIGFAAGDQGLIHRFF